MSRGLTPDAAQQILKLQIEADLQDRLDHLAERATAGQLTPEELDEYRLLVHGVDLISVLQAKARKALKPAVR